jgi:hypothetical protein
MKHPNSSFTPSSFTNAFLGPIRMHTPQSITGALSRVLVVLFFTVPLTACPPPVVDAGTGEDAGGDDDAGSIERDAGRVDDAGVGDAGVGDAGVGDAGVDDAGVDDAGITLTCAIRGQTPIDEVCNGYDDDCDGVVDEDVCDDPCSVVW